jgi:hypothetical protein
VNSWLPGTGECRTGWFQTTSKPLRDYKASQAHKTLGYIKHTVGQWKHVGQREQFWLCIYYKESPT